MEITDGLRQKVAGYRPTPVALQPIAHTPLVFLVGITSAGKNAVLNHLLRDFPGRYSFIISHTTRAPRENHGIIEQNGVEYYFVDADEMGRMLDGHEMAEAQVIHDAWVSGTSIAEIDRAQTGGRIPVTDIDIQGAETYDKLGLNVKPIFLMPPNFEVWMRRLLKRYGGNVPRRELELRMQSAIREIERAMTLDHFYIVINEDLSKTVEVVNDIARGEPVEPHYHKAMSIAEHLLDQLRAELKKIR